MRRKRVLVVDDSALFRELIAEILNSTDDLEVVGTARDAEKAWQMIETLNPDVATLDVEMPGMDGVSFLRRLMHEHPIPVVMVSTLTHQSSATGLRALEAGAVDLVEKPRLDIRSRTLHMADELIEKVRGASRARVRARAFVSPSQRPRPRTVRATSMPSLPDALRPASLGTLGSAPPSSPRVVGTSSGRAGARIASASGPAPVAYGAGGAARSSIAPARARVQVPAPRSVTRAARVRATPVAIGASTGGTEALLETLRALPENAPPLLIVQHMPRHFTASFAKRLNGLCAMEVIEAEDRARVVPGRALVAPGGYQMRIQRSGTEYIVRVTDEPPVGLHKPSVDVLFESCARQAGAACMGVLLTGMGADGAYGLGEMLRAGAQTIAQDEHSCVVFGMPKEAIERGFAQRILPLQRIARAIVSPK